MTYDFDTVMDNLMEIGQRFADADKMEELTAMVKNKLMGVELEPVYEVDPDTGEVLD